MEGLLMTNELEKGVEGSNHVHFCTVLEVLKKAQVSL
jgi:hypothetical protein